MLASQNPLPNSRTQAGSFNNSLPALGSAANCSRSGDPMNSRRSIGRKKGDQFCDPFRSARPPNPHASNYLHHLLTRSVLSDPVAVSRLRNLNKTTAPSDPSTMVSIL
jgi:hypothetical protein